MGGTISHGPLVTWRDGRFHFAPSQKQDDRFTLKFDGDVLFQGHGGFLRLNVANPWVSREGNTLGVSVDIDGVRVTLANAVSSSTYRAGASQYELELTEEGVPHFGGAYAAGSALDPIELTLPDHFAPVLSK